MSEGDHIQRLDGSFGTVGLVRVVDKTQQMYNFTVGTAHTYFVGDGQWLVHNACKLLPYRIGKGHHIHAKIAFKRNPFYNAGDALALSKVDLKALKWNHRKITGTQKRLFNQLYKDVKMGIRQNTLQEHSDIAYRALVENKVPADEALEYVKISENWLTKRGITEPSCIPWFTCK